MLPVARRLKDGEPQAESWCGTVAFGFGLFVNRREFGIWNEIARKRWGVIRPRRPGPIGFWFRRIIDATPFSDADTRSHWLLPQFDDLEESSLEVSSMTAAIRGPLRWWAVFRTS